jgi:hypothetical protein
MSTGKGRCMRSLGDAVVLVLMIAGVAVSADRYVVPVKNDIPVYEHNPWTKGESPVFLAGTNDWLMEMGSRGMMIRVSDLKGNTGWIDRSSVKQASIGTSLSFGDAAVLAYLDNPSPVYILDAANPFEKSILLDRSFSREMGENIDRETIERIVGVNAPR